MSDELDWAFSGPDDAKAEIRAAVRYLLKDAAGSDRGDIVRQIIEIVGEAARGVPPGEHNSLDDGMPGARRRTRALDGLRKLLVEGLGCSQADPDRGRSDKQDMTKEDQQVPHVIAVTVRSGSPRMNALARL
jgi:hypothetical protein